MTPNLFFVQGHPIMFPDEVDRDPWRCCSLAWEVTQ